MLCGIEVKFEWSNITDNWMDGAAIVQQHHGCPATTKVAIQAQRWGPDPCEVRSALRVAAAPLGAPWACAACAACAAPAACAADSVNVWKHSKRLPRATEVLFHRRFGNSQNSLRVLPHCIDTELLVDGIDRSRLVINNIYSK